MVVEAGSLCRAASGSATHSCRPCRGGPAAARVLRVGDARPLVMRLSSPGRMTAAAEAVAVADLALNSQLTVCRPMCGWGGTRIRVPGCLVRTVAVEEAPGADHAQRPLRQQPAHLGAVADRRLAGLDDVPPPA